MKNKLLLVCVGFLISTPVLSQTLECQLLRERILKMANPPDICTQNWQRCMQYSGGDPFGKQRCNMEQSGCLIAGALVSSLKKEKMDELMMEYKQRCE